MSLKNTDTQLKTLKLDKIKRGDIVLVKTKGFAPSSWLIRRFTRSGFNHVSIVASKPALFPKWILEALPQGIVSRNLETEYIKVLRNDEGRVTNIKSNPKYEIAIVRIKGLTAEQCKQIVNRIYRWAYEGRKYDFLLVSVGMVFHLLTARKWRPKWLNRSKQFICSEVIAEAVYKIAGVKLGKYVESGFVTPADIYNSEITENIYPK